MADQSSSSADDRSSRSILTGDFRRVGAYAGLAYVVLIAIENLDILDSPGYGSSVADIVGTYRASDDRLAITTAAGILALAAFLIAAVTLWSIVRERADDRDAWSVVGLGGAVTAPAVGAIGLVLQSALIVGADDGLSDDSMALLNELRLGVQMIGALPIGLFALGTAIAGWRNGGLPRWIAVPGAAFGLVSLLGSTLVVTGDDAARAVVVASLAAVTVWILVASVWLLLRTWPPARLDSPWVTTARLLAGTVAVAASVSGVALLAFPGSTADFFSWALAPPPLATLIGGLYVASGFVYARAAIAPWAELRIMILGIVALTIPIFTSTLAHLEVFDFGRLQAWAWVVLFGGFFVTAIAVLLCEPASRSRDPVRFSLAARVAATGLAIALLIMSIALWIDPAGGATMLPFTPAPLSGRVLGGWTFLFSVFAAFIAIDGSVGRGRLPALAMVSFPAGALAAAMRSFSDLSPPGTRAAYVAGILVWLGIGIVLLRECGAAERRRASNRGVRSAA